MRNLRKKGFTILETLLYISLFSFIFVGIIEFTLVTGEFNKSAENIITIERSLMFVTSHINEKFNGASSVNGAASIFMNNNGILNIAKGGIDFRYSILNGRIVLEYNAAQYLLSPIDYWADKFFIEPIINAETLDISGVRITIRLSSLKTNNSREITAAFFL